jgi:hypothetical protein
MAEKPSINPSRISKGAPMPVDRIHGDGFVRGGRLGAIESGKVFGMHIETGEVAECAFTEVSGSWLENKYGIFAPVGQAISRDGEPGGEYVVAARVNEDGSVPCIDPAVDDFSGVPYGTELAGEAIIEASNSALNASGLPLRNFATLTVCCSSNPHPDGAELVAVPSPGVFCYKGRGAGLNNRHGWERAENGMYLFPPHAVWNSGFEVPAAKRPNTRSYPPSVNINTPIVWRVVDPNVSIAN